MKIVVSLFILFFLLVPLPPVKCALKDTAKCFIKRGNCRAQCLVTEKKIGPCLKGEASCCAFLVTPHHLRN
ncbi:beta-defensin 133 [Myotis lucifugus]|uniref:beta-defensin 133 n=1 Tax=Myotis lucifugus TaxID=59463 RepID=UPI000CCC68F3|nr:beta-defensin 133 [Myotis lucifugus]